MAKVSVIIAGAGKSERFRGNEKKTFAKLDGRPVFLRTLERFVTRNDVCQTIFAVALEDLEQVKSQYGANLSFMGVTIVEGGAERAKTVEAALTKVSDDAELIAVHDAVRPCVTEEQVDAVFAEASKTGAAILACPVTATLKRVSEVKLIDETVLRTGLYEAQTPQVFRKDVLVKAYKAYIQAGSQADVTDDATLVERTGHAVSVVESTAMNLKITTQDDLRLAGAVLKSIPAQKAPKLGAFEEAQW